MLLFCYFKDLETEAQIGQKICKKAQGVKRLSLDSTSGSLAAESLSFITMLTSHMSCPPMCHGAHVKLKTNFAFDFSVCYNLEAIGQSFHFHTCLKTTKQKIEKSYRISC
jgi:hypothetical protein